MYKDLRGQNQVFDGILAADKTSEGISWRNQSENKDAEIVTGNYFQLLGLKPALGRLLTPRTIQPKTRIRRRPQLQLLEDPLRIGAAISSAKHFS